MLVMVLRELVESLHRTVGELKATCLAQDTSQCIGLCTLYCTCKYKNIIVVEPKMAGI